jgi:AraC family transcriptional regulator
MTFIGAPQTIREAGGFRFGHWFATRDVQPHVHENAHFMYVIAGELATQVQGSSNLIYNPPDTFHRDRFETGGSFFAIEVPKDLAPATKASRMDTARMHALVAGLLRECVDWSVDSPRVAYELCIELVAPDMRDSAPAWLRRVRDEILEHGSVDALAAAAGVHPIHLIRTFRRFYRCTPGEHVRFLRASRAASLLATSRMPLSEVALEAGFADQSHFTKVFRRVYGVPPGEYRRGCSF